MSFLHFTEKEIFSSSNGFYEYHYNYITQIRSFTKMHFHGFYESNFFTRQQINNNARPVKVSKLGISSFENRTNYWLARLVEGVVIGQVLEE